MLELWPLFKGVPTLLGKIFGECSTTNLTYTGTPTPEGWGVPDVVEKANDSGDGRNKVTNTALNNL